MKKLKVPAELGPAGRRLWRQIIDEYEILDSGGQAHLLAACRAEDDVQRMRKTIAEEGDVFKKDPSKPHPLLAAVRGSEAVRRQSLRALNLDVGPEKTVGPGRPPLEEATLTLCTESQGAERRRTLGIRSRAH